MQKQKRHIYFIYVLFIGFVFKPLWAQLPSNFTNEYFLFIDHQKQEPVLVLDDSTIYRGYGFNKSKLENLPSDIPLKDLKAIGLKNQTYIVDEGCGPIFKFHNSKIEKVNKSFRHRNQFNASVFVYKDRFYFFGGYGLFTDKNIVTYFDEGLSEWLEVPIVSEDKPSPRSKCISFLLNNKLYIWGGYVKDHTVFTKTVDDDVVWALDLEKNIWGKTGKIKTLKFSPQNRHIIFKKNEIPYILSRNAFYKIDILKDKVSQYEFSIPNLLECVYDPYSDKIILINKNTGNEGKNVTVIPFDELTKTLISKTTFYSSNTKSYLVLIVLATGVLMMFLFWKNRGSKVSNIEYDKKNNLFRLKQRPLVLDDELHNLLVYLTENQERFILLDSINELFVTKKERESYITVNKRRDIAVKKLVFNLKTLLNKEEQEILIERKNVRDKRIKEIKLGIIIEIIE